MKKINIKKSDSSVSKKLNNIIEKKSMLSSKKLKVPIAVTEFLIPLNIMAPYRELERELNIKNDMKKLSKINNILLELFHDWKIEYLSYEENVKIQGIIFNSLKAKDNIEFRLKLLKQTIKYFSREERSEFTSSILTSDFKIILNAIENMSHREFIALKKILHAININRMLIEIKAYDHLNTYEYTYDVFLTIKDNFPNIYKESMKINIPNSIKTNIITDILSNEEIRKIRSFLLKGLSVDNITSFVMDTSYKLRKLSMVETIVKPQRDHNIDFGERIYDEEIVAITNEGKALSFILNKIDGISFEEIYSNESISHNFQTALSSLEEGLIKKDIININYKFW